MFSNGHNLPAFEIGTEFKLQESRRLNMEEVENDWAKSLGTAVALDEDDDNCHDQDDDRDQSLQDYHQFPNALRIPGLKHVSDNLLSSTLRATSCWEKLLTSLRHLESLLSNRMARERFAFFCLDAADQKAVRHWSLTLKSLRWQAVLQYCEGLLALERVLRKNWSKHSFAQSNDRQDDGHSIDVESVHRCISSAEFWASVHMVVDLSNEADFIGAWAESCPCCEASNKSRDVASTIVPGPRAIGSGCPFSGCRAIELATGRGLKLQSEVLMEDREAQRATVHGIFSFTRTSLSGFDPLDSFEWLLCDSQIFVDTSYITHHPHFDSFLEIM